MAEHAATADEVTAVLAAASRDGIRNVAAWSASTVGRDDFARRLAELRALPARQERPACGHSGAIDPDTGGCLICAIKAKRTMALADEQASPSASEDDAAARAQLAEIIDPGLWEQREAVLRREGHRELPKVDEPLERKETA